VSRRNQSRRRRTYGRRQHEVRERRVTNDPAADWSQQPETTDFWLSGDSADDPRSLDPTFGEYAQ
jgi:hypothetical protein